MQGLRKEVGEAERDDISLLIRNRGAVCVWRQELRCDEKGGTEVVTSTAHAKLGGSLPQQGWGRNLFHKVHDET